MVISVVKHFGSVLRRRPFFFRSTCFVTAPLRDWFGTCYHVNIYCFFKSINRKWMKWIKTNSQKKKFFDFCPTRWVKKVTGLDDFENLFAPIVFCLEEMSLNLGRVCNQDTSAKATSFYKLITFFDFLSSLVITPPITQLLKGPGIDIADATHLIESLKSLICCKRNTANTFHKKCYCHIVELACKLGIEECKPRTSEL